ncbi:MAG: oxygen-independent coproporphyrinogen III oxidase [Rhodospirillales bacterium]|nr:oxygen-independent coproporphyrinogen III oxidase [Rhodospirillales bacterium]
MTVAIERAEKYDLRVPRYTSYPTAPHFGASVDAGIYSGWLATLDPGAPLSVYVHIPFCDEMCWFCGCWTKIVKRYEPIRSYLDALHGEISLVAAALPARMDVRHLHFGGGSPTMLAPEDWLALTGALGRSFTLAPDVEIAVELDPRDATEEYIAALAQAGVTRASIGVQDFDPKVQLAINRIQPFDVVERVVGWLRRHGIADVNLDLMYGLPHQTEAKVEAMVDLALRLAPARVALFGYAHVPWMKSHQKLIDETTLPGAVERLRQFATASARLASAGYRAVGLDHFARPDDGLSAALAAGRLHRNFQGYTADDAPTLIGLGASAIGTLPQGYVQNAQPLADYRRAIEAGRLPTVRGIALSADDRLRRAIIERLMCNLRVDLDAVCREKGIQADALAAERASLEPLAADGLVRLDGGEIVVTEAGRPFVRLVAAAFDAYLQPGAARHSRAV